MRLIANCNHLQSKVGATTACGNTQLCAGLQSGIEANLHAVKAIWPQSAGWMDNQVQDGDGDVLDSNGDDEDAEDVAGASGTGLDSTSTTSRYTPNTGFGAALFDARNAFNELNRYLMLWNVAHLWNRGSRFAFNRYRHWGICLVRDRPGQLAIELHSK